MIEPLAQARMRTCGVFRFCMCVVSDYCVLGLLLTDGDFDARQSTPKPINCEVSSSVAGGRRSAPPRYTARDSPPYSEHARFSIRKSHKPKLHDVVCSNYA